jgi:tetratricopeptide (TPR) repeat protein
LTLLVVVSAPPCLAGQQQRRPSRTHPQPQSQPPPSEQTAVEEARQKAIAAFEKGQQAHANNDLEQAIQEYTAALDIIPDFPEALYQRGMAYWTRKQFDLAQKDLAQIVKIEADMIASEGQITDPQHRSFFARAHTTLGEILIERGDSASAEGHYQRAIQLDEKLQRARTGLASILMAKGAFPEALQQLQAALAAGAASAPVYSLMGVTYEKTGQPALAMESYTKAIELDPKDSTARARRSQLLVDRQQYQAAIDDLLVVYKQGPSSAAALRLADLHERAGKPAEAIDFFQQALKEPSSPEETQQIRFKLVDLLISAGREAEALAQAEQLANDNPNDAAIIARLGSLLLPTDPAKAANAYARAVRLDPQNVSYETALGTALIKLQRYQDALPPLLDALKRAPDDYYAHSNLATAFFQLKDFAQAAGHFQWIIDQRQETAPEPAIAHYFLAICREKLMEYEPALAAYEKFLTLADAAKHQAEIDTVKFRLPSLRRLIEKGKGKKPQPKGKGAEEPGSGGAGERGSGGGDAARFTDSESVFDKVAQRLQRSHMFIANAPEPIFQLRQERHVSAQETNPPQPASSIAVSQEDIQSRLTAEEWRKVNEQGNQVKRVRELLKVATNRLGRTRQLAAQGSFTEATRLMQDYTEIISHTLTFIDTIPKKDRKRRQSAYKEFDLRVREQIRTLRELRHEFPVGNTVVEEALQTAERLRIMALNQFSGMEMIRVPNERP